MGALGQRARRPAGRARGNGGIRQGKELEPVVVRAMERAGWKVNVADSQDPEEVTMRFGPNLLVTGHPDGTVRLPLDEDDAAAEIQTLLFGDSPPLIRG